MLSSALLLTTNSGGNTSIHKLTVGKDANAYAYGYNRNRDHIYGDLTPAECSVGGVLAPILYFADNVIELMPNYKSKLINDWKQLVDSM